ncbi:MAG: AAA family ATPase [Cryobacterium sp.]|nr:AAA family ATPase [Cryobacterium sp.]
MLYRRLDELQVEAQDELARVRILNVGDHDQSRSERDSFAQLYEDRILQLREVGERLAFGRLELEPDGDGPVRRYIGRIGLRDRDLQPILLDWRVPQASAFYQATARTPMGARARRHLITKGRELVRIEDEVFDPDLLDESSTTVQGEAALLAALTAQRTGRMTDIVATIQAEQDRIIRSDLAGVLVVQGGPGTGKTAVALHRAAYLLYSHRDRLGSSGVLIVGPSRSFLHYIEAVLPSLGESGVVLSSLGGLFPGVEATEEDAPAVAAIKGSTRMAELIKRAVADRQRVPAETQTLDVNGDRIVLEPALIQSAMSKARASGKPYNLARVDFVASALAALTRIYVDQLRAKRAVIDDSDIAVLREDLRTAHDVKVALNTAWLPLTPQKLVQDIFARPEWLAHLAPEWSDAERALLRRDRDAAFTVSDVPLLDEAAELLGEFELNQDADKRARKAQRKRDVENAKAAIANFGLKGYVSAESVADGFADAFAGSTTAERAAADRTWGYGHIVVDEAQELSPMQWRLLRRRSPSKSFTIVGDIAQAASPTASETWEHALAALVGGSQESERWRLEELTVNYRTPGRIAEAAQSMAIAHGLPVTVATSVREGDYPIDVMTDVVAAVRRDRERSDGNGGDAGTLAVIAVPSRVAAVHSALSAEFTVGLGAESLTTEINVLSPRDAKGLEFDSVVVVDPAAIVAASERGAAALFVSMTRPTQRLILVAEGALPKGLENLGD